MKTQSIYKPIKKSLFLLGVVLATFSFTPSSTHAQVVMGPDYFCIWQIDSIVVETNSTKAVFSADNLSSYKESYYDALVFFEIDPYVVCLENGEKSKEYVSQRTLDGDRLTLTIGGKSITYTAEHYYSTLHQTTMARLKKKDEHGLATIYIYRLADKL